MMRGLLMTAGFLATVLAPAEEDPRLDQSREIAKSLQQQLGQRLKLAMAAGGPLEALATCKLDAPVITSQVSERMGARVARTALKVRNSANKANAVQQSILEDFRHQMTTGSGALERFDMAADGSAQYMKAIPTQALCLVCHGSEVGPEVTAAIARLYPDDQATGFSVGDLRGAFVVQWPPTTEQ